MIAAMEGREVDMIPIAPWFWGAEYVWKIVGQPIWEVLHAPEDMHTKVLDALEMRHGCDWLIPLHSSSGALTGKTLVRETRAQVVFTDDATGEEWVFDKEGHWLERADRVGDIRANNEGAGIDPPTTKAETDDWLKRALPNLMREGEAPAEPRKPNHAMRERFPDRFLANGTNAPFAAFAYTMGFEPALVMLHDNPSLVAYILEVIVRDMPAHCRWLADSGFDGGMMVDSWASADIMSPETYANWVAPIHKFISDELHKVGLKSIMYNTGNLIPLMDTIVKLGYDAISPEERIKGVEMDIGEMREMVGPDQCLFGNFDSYLLARGDRDAIRSEVHRQIESAGPRAFIMGTGSPICDATEPDVIDFWMDEIRGYGT